MKNVVIVYELLNASTTQTQLIVSELTYHHFHFLLSHLFLNSHPFIINKHELWILRDYKGIQFHRCIISKLLGFEHWNANWRQSQWHLQAAITCVWLYTLEVCALRKPKKIITYFLTLSCLIFCFCLFVDCFSGPCHVECYLSLGKLDILKLTFVFEVLRSIIV